MQLYVFPPSPNSLCCQAVANQAGIELELVTVDLSAGAHMSPDFIKLNPNHKIPTLTDGDFSLWESSAIMLYLAQQAPESNLIPDDPKLRAQMAQWLFWKTAHWGPACGVYVFENIAKKLLGMGDPDPAVIEKGSEDFHRFAEVLNDHLKGRDSLVGESVTIADHASVSWLVHAEGAGLPLDNYAEINRWTQAMLSSDPWKKAVAPFMGE